MATLATLDERFTVLEKKICNPQSVIHVDGLLVSAYVHLKKGHWHENLEPLGILFTMNVVGHGVITQHNVSCDMLSINS